VVELPQAIVASTRTTPKARRNPDRIIPLTSRWHGG
jgi:hypothetical protein